MKRLLHAALITVGVSGCATQWPDPSAIEPAKPRIFVTSNNLLVVNQDPVIVPREGNRTVTWQLPPNGRARFSKENGIGITIDMIDKLLMPDGSAMKDTGRVATANAELKRRAGTRVSLVPCRYENEFEFSCTFPNDLPKGLFAYTIRVMIGGKPVELDPRVMPE